MVSTNSHSIFRMIVQGGYKKDIIILGGLFHGEVHTVFVKFHSRYNEFSY